MNFHVLLYDVLKQIIGDFLMSLVTKTFIKVIALFWAFSVVSYSATIPNFYKNGDEVQKSELSSNPKSIDQNIICLIRFMSKSNINSPT